MSNRLNPALVSEIDSIDYVVAQFPGGGQRGYATALLLEWFEKETELPTHQLFPYVTAGSVGILITAALYSPHPEHKAARMSAAQLVSIFPEIASRIPENIALLRNNNSYEPLEEAVRLLIGDTKLKDVLGTVHLSAHKIGARKNSYVTSEKWVNPHTGEITYEGDPDLDLVEIAARGTALSSVYNHRNEHTDFAFLEMPATFIDTIKNLFNASAKGSFVRVGNFDTAVRAGASHFEGKGLVPLIRSGTMVDEIADHIASQFFKFLESKFSRFVFDLEPEIEEDHPDPPSTQANVSGSGQFEKTKELVGRYIQENKEVLTALALRLKTLALERIERAPETAFGIEPRVQKFPLPDLPVYTQPKPIIREGFASAASGTVRLTRLTASTTADVAVRIATSEPVKRTLRDISDSILHGLRRIDEVCLPQGHLSSPSIRPVAIEDDSAESRFNMP